MIFLVSTLLALSSLQQQTPPVKPKLTAVPSLAPVDISGTLKPVAISPDEAARVAIDKNPKVRIAQAAVDFAHGKFLEARAPALPTLTINSSGNDVTPIGPQSSSTNGGGSLSAGSAGQGISSNATLKFLVFDFGHTIALIRQSSATERAAFHAYSRAQQDAAFQAKQAYYQLLQNQGLVRVQEANLADRQAQLDLATARFNAGPGAPSDVLRAQTAVGDATQQLVQAKAAVLISQIALASAMGIDPRTPITTMDSSEPAISDDLDSLVNKALKVRPDLLQNLQQIRAAGYEVVAAKTNNAPSVSVNAIYAAKGISQPFDSQSGALGVALTWSIGDGGVAAGKTREADADLATAKMNLELIQIGIGSDVAGNWSAMKYAEQRVAIAASEEKNAQENLRIAQGRFQSGLGTFLEVTDAEASFVAAREAVVSANAALMIARAALRHAVGD